MERTPLSIYDRILLRNILPPTGDIITMRVLADLHKALGFTEEELAEFEIKQVDERISWKNGRLVPIEIGPKAIRIIVEALEKLNEEKKITIELVSLYERFVEGIEADREPRQIRRAKGREKATAVGE